ncbi:hypothetical protein AKJ16_DCAP05896 [Drosera capensis]
MMSSITPSSISFETLFVQTLAALFPFFPFVFVKQFAPKNIQSIIISVEFTFNIFTSNHPITKVFSVDQCKFISSSLEYFGARQVESSCVLSNGTRREGFVPALDLDRLFPADSHGAVVYHGAPWKAEIGRWLSGCDSIAKETNIVEQLSGKACKNNCSGHGVCNPELGQCRCFHGFAGEGCFETLQLDCNYPGSPDLPHGRWVVSICSAHCDTTRAMCFCGEGTQFPNRPVAETCGFKIVLPTKPGDPKLTDWGKPDLDVFTSNNSNARMVQS